MGYLTEKKRWHNNHIVIVLGIDWKKERFVVCDPYYMQEKQFVPFSQIKEASKFCYLMESEWYQRANEEEIRKRAFEALENEEPIRNMERFLSDFSARIQKLEVDGLFDLDWVLTIEQGFMTRHYLWIFYRNLYINGRNNLHGFLSVGFFKCLQQWKECVVHSHKAVRKKKQNIYYQRFIDSFYKVLSIEKEIHRCIRNRNFSAPQVLSGQAVPFKANQIPFDLIPYFNSRACKTSLKDRIDADVTGEGEFILPTKKRFRIIKKDKIRYPVFLGEKLDHVRCSGQTLMLPSDMQWKGIACLVCSEWGCSQLLLTVKGERADYITDFIVNDFSFEQENSICIGKSFLSGNKKDTILQKKVFFQSVYFGFPEDDCIKEIVVPDCSSLHLFSMVLMS